MLRRARGGCCWALVVLYVGFPRDASRWKSALSASGGAIGSGWRTCHAKIVSTCHYIIHHKEVPDLETLVLICVGIRLDNIISCFCRLSHINPVPSFRSSQPSLFWTWRRAAVYGTSPVRSTAPERIACWTPLSDLTQPKLFNIIFIVVPCPYQTSATPYMLETRLTRHLPSPPLPSSSQPP